MRWQGWHTGPPAGGPAGASPGEAPERGAGATGGRAGRARGAARAAVALAALAGASALGALFQARGYSDTNVVVVYILAVLVAARVTRSFAFGLAASVLATFAFNYFFADPRFTFGVRDPNYIVTFVTMAVTAFVTASLTSHAQRAAQEAREKERETQVVYRLTSRLTDARDQDDVAAAVVTAVSERFGCQAGFLCFGEGGAPEPAFVQYAGPGRLVKRQAAPAQGAFPEFADWPVEGQEGALGVARVPSARAAAMGPAERRVLSAILGYAALALDRVRSLERQAATREEANKERYRGILLRAVSHDIRTPLSAIMGTAEMIKGMTGRDDPRYALAGRVQQDAEWLHSLVENILSLTRLRDGRFTLNLRPEAAEEVVGAAVARVSARAPGHEIAVEAPSELLMVPMDAKLVEQALINLLDNAVRHSPPGPGIKVSVWRDAGGGGALFRVSDRGTGILPEDLPHVFGMFYTTGRPETPDARRGGGLGLAICESVARAHGGSISARNRDPGPGAEFTFALPLAQGAGEGAGGEGAAGGGAGGEGAATGGAGEGAGGGAA